MSLTALEYAANLATLPCRVGVGARRQNLVR